MQSMNPCHRAEAVFGATAPSFIFKEKCMLPQKKFSTFSEQVEWLQDEKKLIISDKQYAEDVLKHIGYFPLMGGYKHLFRIPLTKKYKDGTSFDEIVSLYEFDAELRELFFKYLLQIERHLRSLMSYYLNIPDEIPSAVRRYGNHFLASLLCIPKYNFYENISKGCYAPQMRQGLDKYPHRNGHVIKHKKDDKFFIKK